MLCALQTECLCADLVVASVFSFPMPHSSSLLQFAPTSMNGYTDQTSRITVADRPVEIKAPLPDLNSDKHLLWCSSALDSTRPSVFFHISQGVVYNP